MRAIVQRVSRASVTVDGAVIGEIGKGFLVLLGVGNGDTEAEAAQLAYKVANLRIFEDNNEKMNLSTKDVEGEMLVVSNFTLMADCRQGHRPSFINAARPEAAEPLYERFMQNLKENGIGRVEGGKFRADMKVSLVNDGPVTVIIDTEDLKK